MSRSKGNRTERKVREIYDRAGFETEPWRDTRYERSDGFNLFDFMAIHPDRKPRLNQTKSNSTQGELGPFCEAIRTRFPWPEHVVGDFVVWHDQYGCRLLQPTQTGHTTVYDARETDAAAGEGIVEVLE